MKVYAVWSGEYSDAHIKAIFLREETALAMVEALQKTGSYWRSDARVQEYEVSDGGPEEMTPVQEYSASWEEGIDGPHFEWEDPDYEPELKLKSEVPYPCSTIEADYRAGSGKMIHYITIRGQDPAAIKKAMHDRIAAYKAQQEGIS